MESLALPPVFFHPMSWLVIEWISRNSFFLIVDGTTALLLLLLALIIWAIRPIDLWNEWKTRKFSFAFPMLGLVWDLISGYLPTWQTLVFLGLRWLSISILFAVVWSIFMTLFGNNRDDEEE